MLTGALRSLLVPGLVLPHGQAVQGIAAPKVLPPYTALRFDLIHSPDHLDPTEPDAPEQVYACTTDHPAAAELVLHQSKLGDLLRVTGTITELDAPGTPPRLRVHSVDILGVAPLALLHQRGAGRGVGARPRRP
ncbi:hypothetical protein ABZ905_34445 [Streptomyces parvus]|uniref:hypothetical protein n=1 Tax=Streptomyces parvus TaxID=66428 RepID=UPI0033D7B987